MIKFKRIVILLIILAAIPCVIKSSEAKNIRRFALIAGANNGGSDRVLLKYAVSDADTMMNVLKSIGGVSDSDGILLVNPDRRNFISAMSKIKTEIDRSRDRNERIEFIFYYSGHSNEEAILLGREKIFYKELKDGIKKIPADVRIAILDSCSSGAFTRIKGGKFRPPFILDSSFNMKGDAFMTSSSANEASQESDSIKGSFFTYYLVSGLRGAADMIQDGRITLNEAYQYAYNETLARTEKTMGGTQHPNYDIQMTGTGDVVITDIKRKTSGLLIEKRIAGKVYIRNDDNILIAELQKSYGREMEIALPEGEYSLSARIDDNLFESKITIPSGDRYILAQSDMTPTGTESTVYKGNTKPENKKNKKVIFSTDKITHGGYIGVYNQATVMNGRFCNLTGGKAAWIINHNFALGAGGYGLTYPVNREKFTGETYTGIETDTAFGFGGVLLEYYVWPEDVITIAPGIITGAGAIKYYDPNSPDDKNDEENGGDKFFVILPEINIYINVTEHVRIGAGISYRFVYGIDQNNLTDKDIRGFSFSVSAAAGFF